MVQTVKVAAVKVENAAPDGKVPAARDVKGRQEDDKVESGVANLVVKGVAAPEKTGVTSENCKIECHPSAVGLQPDPARILSK